jgi:hypothetical protein
LIGGSERAKESLLSWETKPFLQSPLPEIPLTDVVE